MTTVLHSQEVLTENPELLENIIRIMTENHLNPNAALIHILNSQQKSANALHHQQQQQQQQQPTPPSAHALNSLPVGAGGGAGGGAAFPGLSNQHLGVLSHMAGQSPSSAVKPSTSSYGAATNGGPRPNLMDFYHIYQHSAFNRNQPR